MLLTVIGMAVAVYVMVTAGMYFMQRGFMYFPDTTRHAPAQFGLDGVDEVEIARPDGVTLVAWHRQAEPGRATILYFHGNAGSIASRAPRAAHWAGRGYGILFVNHRGYGGSGGSPSEAALIGDGLAAFDHLTGEGVEPDSIVVFGESLGSGVAVPVAAERDVLALVLEAPFSSAVDVAAAAYPFLPVRFLMKDRFMNSERIAEVDAPVLIVHGDRDGVVPFKLGRRLFEAAVEPKRFEAVSGAGHNDLDTDAVRAMIEAFIEEAAAEK